MARRGIQRERKLGGGGGRQDTRRTPIAQPRQRGVTAPPVTPHPVKGGVVTPTPTPRDLPTRRPGFVPPTRTPRGLPPIPAPTPRELPPYEPQPVRRVTTAEARRQADIARLRRRHAR